MSSIAKLSEWYQAQCVDDWQEQYGIKIDTLDNPGWSLKIDLLRTKLHDKEFPLVERLRSEHY